MSEIDPEGPTICCRPVDWTPMAELLPGAEETPVYPGSIIRSCQGCGRDVWVGPKQQEQLFGHAVNVGCFVCLAQYLKEGGQVQGPIVDLGNTFRRRTDG